MKKFVFVLLSLSVIIFLASLFFFFFQPVLEKRDFTAVASVSGNVVGLDVNSSALAFGSIPLGSSSTRNVLVNNGYDFPVIVESVAYGNITEIILPMRATVIPAHESLSVPFTVRSYENTSYGDYQGVVSVRLRRAVRF